MLGLFPEARQARHGADLGLALGPNEIVAASGLTPASAGTGELASSP
jgi:hypothetical protein